jgi:two-component system LytT family sensor kinase
MGYLEANIIAQTSGFALGTALATLLLVLVSRSGGTSRGPRFLFAICILIANGAGLVKNIALLVDPFFDPALERQIRSTGFAAAALLPYSILLVWRDNAVSTIRRRIGDWLVVYSGLSGVLIGMALIGGAWASFWISHIPALRFLLNQDSVGNLTFYNGLAMLLLGGIVLLPGTLGSTIDRISLALMLTGLSISTVSAAVATYRHPLGGLSHIFEVTRFQSIILLVIGVFFYFSRFRAADIFAKYAIRLLLAGSLSMAGALILFGPLSSRFHSAPLPQAAAILSAATIVGCDLWLYLRMGIWIDHFVEGRIFRTRNPRLAILEFRRQLGLLNSKSAALTLAHSVAAETLAMKPDEVSVQPVSAEHGATPGDLSIPIPSRKDRSQLVISLAGNRRILLTTEVDLLHEIVLHAGRRLDDLDREEERIEVIREEGRLSQQLVEAELRALRAQINPHFLFNSLNTIASLIASEPEKAEKITVRLGSMFRYVLIHADRPLSSLGEEIEFLRTFLDIEQIRFGKRLLVEFEMEPSIAFAPIPSLILQPLVENAIKHGLAPKIGKGRILVSAKRISNMILVDVEDNGVGLRPSGSIDRRLPSGTTQQTGIGLQNIRERLHTMYGSNAKLSLNDLERGGCRASLEIPINGAKNANSSTVG